MSVSDEAVEAAYDVSQHLLITTAQIELILTAAAPFIAAQAWDEGFTACAQEHVAQGKDAQHPITRKNPHRSDT